MRRLNSVTAVLALLTAAVSLLVALSGINEAAAIAAGFIPARLSGLVTLSSPVPAILTPLTATLLHGGFLHLALNLLMLVWVGSQVERLLGGPAVLACYVIGAIAAALAQWGFDPASPVPMIGASGAISALFGTYALMFGEPKKLFRSRGANRALHAAWLLAAWIVIQWMTAMLAGDQGMLLATPAHIGGFVAGLLLERPLLLWRYRAA
jgi:membrane associated rhomboid family serine protease